MSLSLSVNSHVKSSASCDMQPEHWIYIIPMITQSMTHCSTILAVGLELISWRASIVFMAQSLT